MNVAVIIECEKSSCPYHNGKIEGGGLCSVPEEMSILPNGMCRGAAVFDGIDISKMDVSKSAYKMASNIYKMWVQYKEENPHGWDYEDWLIERSR
jgi:hypothetical protein